MCSTISLFYIQSISVKNAFSLEFSNIVIFCQLSNPSLGKLLFSYFELIEFVSFNPNKRYGQIFLSEIEVACLLYQISAILQKIQENLEGSLIGRLLCFENSPILFERKQGSSSFTIIKLFSRASKCYTTDVCQILTDRKQNYCQIFQLLLPSSAQAPAKLGLVAFPVGLHPTGKV